MSLTITRNKYGEALAGLESMGLMPAWREFLAAKRFSSPFWKVRRESSVRRASSASVELADACLYILDNHVMVSP